MEKVKKEGKKMKLLTNYKELKNEEKNGIELYFDSIPTEEERTELKANGYRWNKAKKCWYISLGYTKKETPQKAELKTLKKLDSEEVQKIAEDLWDTPKMQQYIIDTYDFYKTNDGLVIEFKKVNKISITKELYYYDDTENPGTSENVFLSYNRHNVPGRSLEEYLQEKENLQTNGCVIQKAHAGADIALPLSVQTEGQGDVGLRCFAGEFHCSHHRPSSRRMSSAARRKASISAGDPMVTRFQSAMRGSEK